MAIVLSALNAAIAHLVIEALFSKPHWNALHTYLYM